MAGSRRLVLNGLTAQEEPAGWAPLRGRARGRGSAAPQEFYHELELFRQLLALPPTPAEPRRCRTPTPARASLSAPLCQADHSLSEEHLHSPADRDSRVPGDPPDTLEHPELSEPVDDVARTQQYPRVVRRATYLGSFPVRGAEGVEGATSPAEGDAVTAQLHLMKENGRAVPVLVVVALSGVKVCDPADQSVRMCHALRRISYATCEATRALFALVAREPRSEPPHHYCHAFHTDTPEQAEELNSLVGDAFRMAFASQLQPSAPLWSKELGELSGMGVRAPDSLPGLTHHYPPCPDRCRSPPKCDLLGEASASPSSSEESQSPTETSSYRRLGERAPLMRRLARGLTGSGPAAALLLPSDDDSTPLVTDTPTTPTNLPLCLNGGYINEASDAEARTRESNREPPAIPAAPRRVDHLMHNDPDVDFRRCNNIKNGSSGACSHATSSSSGASSCGASPASGNNNVPRTEPELKQAPWFQHGIPREIALEVLGSQPVGAFLVRGSTTQAGCYALSVRVPRDFQPSGIAHYLILRTPKGYKIKGFTKEFSSLSALVTHHSVMPELLPVPLRLARAPARAHAHARDHADLDALRHAHAHAHAHRHAGFLAQL